MKISKTALLKIVRDSIIDPRKDNLARITIENNTRIQLLFRAKEEITIYLEIDDDKSRLLKAIWLIATAIFKRDHEEI